MKPILEVHNLSKEFLIGANNEPYLALRDILANPFKLLNQPKKEVFKALDNVSFDVMPGESIGIIGRNGAGKSTLLKILSKITPPSSGKIICRGRIAALLEVGTGFHAELTGRENVYMNGSILGMRKWEIDKHFDEIVDFSGVEKFLDTPLKRYSSGMQLRLAFAVAAHLEPEILIIDEVLAVGDAEFQKKCLGKMDEVTKSGRTVLFVSHNMAAVKSLCNKGVLLENGVIKTVGLVDDSILRYFKSDKYLSNYINYKETHQNEWFKLNEIRIYSKIEETKIDLDEYDELILKTNIDILKENEHIKFTYVIKSSFSESLFTFTHKDIVLEKGNNIVLCNFPKGFLNIGEYFIDFYIIYNSIETLYNSNDIFSFKVIEGNRPIGSWMGRELGFIKPNFEWIKI